MAPHRSPGGWRGPVALLVATFVASRLWFRAAGVRFDDGPLQYYWQYVEVELLRTRLAESVLHLHSQPPLFNLFLGAGDPLLLVLAAVLLADAWRWPAPARTGDAGRP